MTARAAKIRQRSWRALAATILLVSTVSLWGVDAEVEMYQRQAEEACRKAEAEWREAKCPGEGSPAGDALVEAAVRADRPELVDQVLAGGDPWKRMRPIPHDSRRVPLHMVYEFKEVRARLDEEMFASGGWKGWLARRVTKDAIEVWTSEHGWLFDGRGRLLHEADPPRRSGWGREWYGAFLPDGRWVTSDLDKLDGTLSFFSASGKWLRAQTCDQLAPHASDDDFSAKLLGWGRSDRRGEGWVVNVGSEEGWATVWIGPTGPARILKPGERWALCYPRALGPRGTLWEMGVPDDAGRIRLQRDEDGHGAGVGYPGYTSESAERTLQIANGNHVFGFWPGRTSFFVGAESRDPREAGGLRTRKFADDGPGDPTPIVDKTWFFDSGAKLQGWVRARRIGDAADGRSMLFRVVADSRIMTMGPDLRVKGMRRFVWADGHTADAVILWDDLRRGMFVRDHRLILARW